MLNSKGHKCHAYSECEHVNVIEKMNPVFANQFVSPHDFLFAAYLINSICTFEALHMQNLIVQFSTTELVKLSTFKPW